MRVSIVCANHGRDLSLLMKSIENSSRKIDEVHIIDVGLERSAQRNMGIKASTADAILVLDSDQSISKDLVKECVRLFKAGFSAIYIPEVIIAESFFGKIRAFERSFLNGTHVDVPRFVLRKACPMFNEELSGPEDALWGSEIRGPRTMCHSVMYHNDDIGFIDYCKKKSYYTKSMKRYAELNPDDPCLSFWYRCVTVFTEKGKWKKLIRHPILSIGVILLLATRGVIYYVNR